MWHPNQKTTREGKKMIELVVAILLAILSALLLLLGLLAFNMADEFPKRQRLIIKICAAVSLVTYAVVIALIIGDVT